MAGRDETEPGAKDESDARSGGRGTLDKQRIVDAALEFIDEHGLQGLTMRQLGTSLGVEAMSLYRYVPGKEELLDAVVEGLLDKLHTDPEVHAEPRDGWQDFLQRMAHGIRNIAMQHPRAFPLMVSRPPAAPWLRPPLRSLPWVEAFLTGLIKEGFTPEAAVQAYRSFTSFLLGSLLLETAAKGLESLVVQVDTDSDRLDSVHEYPTLAALRPTLSEDHSTQEFEEALEDLLNRLTLVLRDAAASTGA